MFTLEEILEKYPTVLDILERGPWRKYELQEILKCSRGEVEIILDVLSKEGVLENSSLGWKLKDQGDPNENRF